MGPARPAACENGAVSEAQTTTAEGEATGVAGAIERSPVYPLGTKVNSSGHLEVGGCDLVEVARAHGTPAYVYAPDDIRSRARAYLDGFAERGIDGEVLYAGKAAPISAIYRLLAEEGTSVDVASGGELHMALGAGFDPERIYMHGNNKTERELRYAIDSEVGCIIVDSFDEIKRLDRMLDRRQRVMVRVTPGIKPSTHSYIQTGQLDSKFGFGIEGGQAQAAIDAVVDSANLHLVGLHAHIGSQIFELEPYVKAVEALAALADGLELELLNLGGGLGVAYEGSDEPPSIPSYVQTKLEAVRRHFDPMPNILIEPGRSLVANAGLTIYEIGTLKEVPGIRTYVAVDGGMADNLRPMLYGARYEAVIANRADADPDTPVRVAGMHCESGDILIDEVSLASPRPGDLLAMAATGAYAHAMANNYNAVPRPPVIFCEDGEARVVVRRERWEDLVGRDV